MAGVIRLNAEGLQSSSTQLKQKGDEFESLIGDLQRIVESLPESWEGAAAEAFVEQFHSLKPGLDETRNLIETIAVQIDQTLQAAQELDDKIASQLG